ncbi:hypothetical protein GOP47_0010947 [Adiantum capillus-veneris]|uniref:Reverse transcriptase zinc-binding domain-containing protein n=1 Tax=Adiantum capillus-veneris TaxID=13818 RepID=A0A9D4UW32_ADICA|nr:hypothetical protein GOP47_0010947 [Adiantum capillus-veneris]
MQQTRHSLPNSQHATQAVARRQYGLGYRCKRDWHQLRAHVYSLPMFNSVNEEERFRDWALPGHSANWWKSHTNVFYILLLPENNMYQRCNKQWSLRMNVLWWNNVLSSIWLVPNQFKFKFFLWRVCTGTLATAANLNRKGFTNGTCARCKKLETVRHIFWHCKIVAKWWKWAEYKWYTTWGVQITKYKLTFAKVNMQHDNALQFALHSFRIWFLWFIWSMRNLEIFEKNTGFNHTVPMRVIRDMMIEDAMVLKDKDFRDRVMHVLNKLIV